MESLKNGQNPDIDKTDDSLTESAEKKSGLLAKFRETMKRFWKDEVGAVEMGKEYSKESNRFSGLPYRQRDDKETVMAAMREDGWSLQFVSKRLRGDREVVLEAVKSYGLALRWIPKGLRDDPEIILRAVHNNGEALQYASERLRCCRQIVFTAVSQNGRAMRFVDCPELIGDPDLNAIAEKTFKHRKRERQ